MGAALILWDISQNTLIQLINTSTIHFERADMEEPFTAAKNLALFIVGFRVRVSVGILKMQ